jgi:GAF domain-containing protein
MPGNKIRVAIIGAQESDLPVLSALHNRKDVDLVMVYDRDRRAVGVEMAEILGLPRAHAPEDLAELGEIDYAAVSEPREKFAAEIEVLSRAGARLLNPSEVFERFHGVDEKVERGETDTDASPRSIEDTFSAIERLLDRRELLKFLLNVGVESIGGSAGSIMLYSSETDELYIAYATGLSERVVKQTRQKLGQGVAGTVARTKRPELLTSAGEIAFYAGPRERVDIGSAICVPLIWGERLLGVLNVSVGRDGRQFDGRDLEKLKELSRRISRVLQQSIDLEAVHTRHREWKFSSTVGEIAAKGISTLEKFAVLARYLSDLVGAETAEIFLNTSEGDWFVLGGSNRLLTPKKSRIRYQSAALSRSFLENRCIVLSEGESDSESAIAPCSSVVYCPLVEVEPHGVAVVEFGDRYKVEEFLLVRDAITREIARFLFAELRDRRLNRELAALRAVTDAASSILTCRTPERLAEIIAATAGAVLESKQVSVRLRQGASEERYAESFFGVPADRLMEWRAEDQTRFVALAKERKPFSTAFLGFEPSVVDEARRYRSLLAFPLQNEDGFFGGIIAYDKSPDDPLEDAVYTELDRKVLANLMHIALPVLDTMLRRGPAGGRGEPGALDLVYSENLERFKRACADEIGRSDRYHHAFNVLLFRITALKMLFERDRVRALALVEDISQGLQTRTRKTDLGEWIGLDTYAVLTLDAGRRSRFLVARMTSYLAKDVSVLDEFPVERKKILVGSATYPGPSKTADDLLAEAEKTFKPASQD